jgi:metal-responsive CopG/Arc/MetJ family transcriptional regulator
VSLSLPEELLKRLDEAANKNKMSRSEFITRILEKTLSPEEEIHKSTESMFGVDPWLTTQNLRDEEEPHETS